MKQLFLSLGLILFVVPATLLAQEDARLTRFTTGLEMSSGLAGHDCCGESWGYFRIGNNTTYRLSRLLSLEASLNYLHLEGMLLSYSNGSQFNLRGFQTWHNVSLMLGPSFHFSSRKSREWSFIPKAGMMLNNMAQKIKNNGSPYQNRRYKSDFLPVYEADLRMSWWFTDRLAFETGVAYFGSLQSGKSLRTKSVEGVPVSSENQELPAYYLEDISKKHGKMFGFNFLLGLRFRL